MAEQSNLPLAEREPHTSVLEYGEWFVSEATAIPEGSHRIVQVDGTEIGIFHRRTRWYAYRNICPHQGGPVCDGDIMPKVEAVVDSAGAIVAEQFSTSVDHLVCPWHGSEYRLDTGVCSADPRRHLVSYDVVLRDGDVYVRI
jgi:nitrite reductase/ring-hydroxylating ferredoxin subunit